MTSTQDKQRLCLGSLTLGEIPQIAVAFSDQLSTEAINHALATGIDIAELRIDQYASTDTAHVLNEISKFRTLPVIATIRSKAERAPSDNKNWHGTEMERLSLFKTVIPHVDAIDIELSSQEILQEVIAATHQAGKLTIVSYHNFISTPTYDDLLATVNKAKKQGGDIVKISCMACSQHDMQHLARITIDCATRNIMTIAMGSKGSLSRLFFPALGSLITFASIKGSSTTAPGQLSLAKTLDVLRLCYPEMNQDV